MTGARIEITLDDTELLEALNAALSRLEDEAGLYDAIGAELADGVQRRFIAAQDPDGDDWEESERARLKERGGKTLTDTGRLQQSITWSVEEGGVLVGTNVEYAAIHQFGGEIEQPARKQTLLIDDEKGGFVSARARTGGLQRVVEAAIGARTITMPARPFLGLDDIDRVAIEGIASDWLEGAFA